ncbi:MAG: chromosome segregation protein SMC [Catonella sp.]|uniref:chromosome segregation protein SMC n=1 Tax=Catonella sp. TaxID=2382125 RepID=UPI003F9ED94C
MYLKSVEIQGFKSFANKIVFSFKDGITGIVGPNGSGKSNVADAVRWVLGEQSAKQLRGSKMEDVIFSGTEIRKAQSFAFVAITIDNSDKVLPIDYEEVTVARRVYRSGESEYLINGHGCRLKDISELFLDTGIGKEGYSIIGQGQIEKIISGRPEDRRELFDEAVGITKFKKRKAESIKNLEEESANLARVKDIMSELERQIGPLSKQAETAKLYLGYRDELRKYEIINFINEYDNIAESKTKAESDKILAEGNLKDAESSYNDIKEEYEQLEQLLNEKTVLIDEAVKIISAKQVENEKAEGELKLIKEQISSINKNLEDNEARIKQAEDKLEGTVKEEEGIRLKIQELDRREEKLLSEDTVLKSVLTEKLSFKIEIENKRDIKLNEKAGREKLRAEAKGRIELYKSNLEQHKIRRLEINQKILRNKEISDSLNAQYNEATGKIEELTEQFAKLEMAYTDAQESIERLTKERLAKDKEVSEKQKEMLSSKALLSSLMNMAEKYDGYGNAVKRVMEHRKEENGIIGVVADIVKVKPKYETAVETAMGGAIQNIVTDKEVTAKRTIIWLKENKLGRATFLPLDAMTLHNPGNFGGALNEEGIVGVASSLVEFEPRYAGLVNHILGRTLVAENMDYAVKIARKYRYSLRIVTLDGEQLNPGGSISGGAFRNTSNLLGRAREIEEKKESLSVLEKEYNELKKAVEDIRVAINEAKNSASIYKDNISEIRVSLKTEQNNMKQLEGRIAEVEQALNEIRLDGTNLDKERDIAEREVEQLDKIINEDGNIQEEDSELDSLIKSLEDTVSEINSINEEINQIKITESTISTEKNFVNESLERINKERTLADAEIEELKKLGLELKLALKEKSEGVEVLLKSIDSLREEIEVSENNRKILIAEKEEISTSYKSFFDKREEIAELRSKLDKEIYRLESIIEKADASLETMVDYIFAEYGITYSEAVKNKLELDAEYTSFALKKLINTQKNLIRELGNVNVGAIEEYKEVGERYELLKTQAEDIVKAEDALRAIIDELDRRMREQFDERFKDINEQFDLAFAELFGGGKGRLELTEGEDVLEAGIKIIAQPPGKKLQNMMQLSGGEKSLTAIALLFAIQNLKPSPFCLLDEIEAALDDSNVTRFADYLHKLTKNTQFIVITHRRGTMNAADMLYGITMQEKGVSTMVSVNLIDADIK